MKIPLHMQTKKEEGVGESRESLVAVRREREEVEPWDWFPAWIVGVCCGAAVSVLTLMFMLWIGADTLDNVRPVPREATTWNTYPRSNISMMILGTDPYPRYDPRDQTMQRMVTEKTEIWCQHRNRSELIGKLELSNCTQKTVHDSPNWQNFEQILVGKLTHQFGQNLGLTGVEKEIKCEMKKMWIQGYNNKPPDMWYSATCTNKEQWDQRRDKIHTKGHPTRRTNM